MYEYSKLTALDPKDLDRSQWTKPKTTRRNLQPPKAERLVNLWAEGKILYDRVYDGSDEADKKNGHEYWAEEESVGLWMLHGENREMFDFRKAENVISSDGVPVHGLRFQLDSAAVEMEAFCDIQRKSSCFVKVSVKNSSNQELIQKISFLLRTDKQKRLAGAADHYSPYNPNVEVWKKRVLPPGNRRLLCLPMDSMSYPFTAMFCLYGIRTWAFWIGRWSWLPEKPRNCSL